MNMIETLNLTWTEPKTINTRRGMRDLRTAAPTPEFWTVWKSSKAELQAAGITVSRYGANWEVSRWSNPAAATSAVVTEALNVTWSEEQNAIFGWFASGTGALEVRARAGTGKTTTIKQAFSVAPEARMLYAVFNKKNQREAQDKITDARVDVKTLHSLGFFFIKSVWQKAQPDDAVERDRILDASPEIPEEAAGVVERLIGFAKNLLLNPTVESLVEVAEDRGLFSALESEEQGGWTVNKLATVALKALEAAKTPDGLSRISFNDMVWLPVVMNWVKPRYDLVCVDEAQDMNLLQLEIAVRACNPNGRICIVGDDRQAIYGFRGAAQDGMGLMRDRLNAQTLGLTVTYRCPKLVVAIAAEIVTDYKAAPTAPEGIVEEIECGMLASKVVVGDAILSRLNAPLMNTCLELLRKGIPARIEGRDIGKQLVGMVRKLRAKSVPDFLRKLSTWGEKQKSRISFGKNAESKIALIDDQVATLAAVAEEASSVSDIESRILALFQDSDENAKPAVVLSSVHKAKGLEWNRVFVLTATFKKNRGQEEANIYYVAVTRAKQTLTFVG